MQRLAVGASKPESNLAAERSVEWRSKDNQRGGAMSTRRRAGAAEARTRHVSIPWLSELKQAPSITAAHLETRRAMVGWCHSMAEEGAGAAWRMLGKAVLSAAVGARLILAVHGHGKGANASLAEDWLTWHRRRGAFTKRDLKRCKKRSKIRALWQSINRGIEKGENCSRMGGGSSAALALSDRASRVLFELKSSGLVRCAVGRLPFHVQGELPEVGQLKGELREGGLRRSAGRVRAASEKEMIELLAAQGGEGCQARRPLGGWDLSRLRPALESVGGSKVMSLKRLAIVMRESNRVGAEGRRMRLAQERAPTLTASRGLVLVYVRVVEGGQVLAEVLSAQDWASLMGVPCLETHRLRVGLREVSDAAGRGLMGQAVHLQAAVQVVLLTMDRLRRSGHDTDKVMGYASLLSGMDVFAAAVAQVCGTRWRFLLAAEANVTASIALRAAWQGQLGTVCGNALGRETAQAMLGLRGRLDLLMISFRCAPWSAANTLPVDSPRRVAQMERALEENQAILALAAGAEPRAIIIECVVGITRPCLREQWGRLQGCIGRLKEWSWAKYVICPRNNLGGWMPRKRIWVIGVRKKVGL